MKRRVLFLAHSALRGGAEFCLDTTLRWLDRERVEPFVIFPAEGPMADSARAMGISVEIVPLCWWMLYEPSFWEWKNRLKIPFRLHFLRKFIRQNRIEAVYSNTVCLFEGVLAARWMGLPHISHIHEVLEDRFMRPRWLSIPKTVQFFCRNSRFVIFESESSRRIAEHHLDFLGTDETEKLTKKMQVVSNSSRLTREEAQNFSEERTIECWKKLEKYGVCANTPTLLWMGRFSERKNPLLLVRALEKLPGTVRDGIQTLFIGAGPLEENLKNGIQSRKLENCCKVVPFQEDVRPILRRAQALVLTSHEESFGLVLVEAGMFALPVVAVRSQGPTEIVRDGETGFLVEDDDAESLSIKICKLFEEQDFCKSMGAANQQRVLSLFDPVKNTQKIENLILEAISCSEL